MTLPDVSCLQTPAEGEMAQRLQRARQASWALASLDCEQKNQALHAFAQLIDDRAEALLRANQDDCQAQAGQISPSLYQRLTLDRGKLAQLASGIRDVAALSDPVGRVLMRTRLDEGLLLEKVSVPLGVIAIIFESRPDVIPQILALALKSGNAVVLKGGSEALASNRAFMALFRELTQICPFLPSDGAQLFESRDDVHRMLAFDQYVDLVIPRGSNALVQSIMAATRIPVMGHADGVCHVLVHAGADLDSAVTVVLDAKTQYPAACNAAETLLVDQAIAEPFWDRFAPAAQQAGLTLYGCPQATTALTARGLAITPLANPAASAGDDAANPDPWHCEYGDKTLAVCVVPSLEAAIQHINRHGSHHTDAILTQDSAAADTFTRRVDSACVFVNASTRFADGFRFGFGAEVGISTAKTHARGPVGLEGLVIYKYLLRGEGHCVAEYVGEQARAFRHEPLATPPENTP